MALGVRLIRAWWVFGLITLSYLTQLGLQKIFDRWARGESQPQRPAWLARRRARVDQKNARRLLNGMLRLRGVYIKLGQVLSVMGGFLPAAYKTELESLQDAVPPHPYDEIAKTIERDLGKPVEALFADFNTTPIAAASLGQVHAATMHDGTQVAVKVLYPAIRDVIAVDLRVLRRGLQVYKWFVPVQNIESVHASLIDLLRRETDYVHEAACIKRMDANFADDAHVVTPQVIDELTTSDVLTMTYMDGIKITNLEELTQAGVSLQKVARRLVEAFYKQLFVHRFFHADPHPGNFLIQPIAGTDDSRLVVLDFGAISEVSQDAVDGMIDLVRGFIEQRDDLVLRGIEAVGFVSADGDRDLLRQTVKTYFGKLMKLDARTPGALMRADHKQLQELADPELERAELRQVMKSVHYPDGWFYVERASVMMFWLVGQIWPDTDPMLVGFPYILPLVQQRIASELPPPMPTPTQARALS